MMFILFLMFLCASYGRSLNHFNTPTLLEEEIDDHRCLISDGFVYCNYRNSCIRDQELCIPLPPKLELLIEPEIKPKIRPTIKARVNVYEIEF